MLRSYGDADVFGETYGEGAVRVVWLHGWARRAEDFTLAARELAEHDVASVALDLPGFGASPLPTVAGGARHYASLLTPTMRQLALEPVVLVGHSFGGTVATVLAAEHPELVRAVVLTGAPVLRRSSAARSPLAYRRVRWLHRHGLLSDQRLEAARQRYGSSDYRRAHGMLREVLVASVNESYEDELRNLRAPVTFLWGEGDLEVPLDVAQRAALLLTSDHALQVLRGVGHMTPLEAPHELANVVEKVLAQ